MKMKKYISIFVTIIMILALAGCAKGDETNKDDGSNADQSEPIKIGLITPTSGDLAVYGQAVENAVKMAEAEINAAGGVNGTEIEIISYDNKGDSTESINVFNRLVSKDKVVSIIGPVVSGTSVVVAPLAEEEGIVMISPTATSLKVTPGRDYVFRACYIDPYQGGTVAKFASQNLKSTKAAVLYNSADDYSTGLANAFQEVFETAGGEIVSFEGFGADDVDFKSILTKIKEQQPEVIFIPTYYDKVGLIATQIKEVGIDAILLGGDGWDGVQADYADVVEGSYFANHYSATDEDELVQKFVTNFKAEFNDTPNALAALAYDATYLTVAALEGASDFSGAAILEAMKASDFNGVTGHIKFDSDGNPIKSISMIKVEDGVLKLETKVGE